VRVAIREQSRAIAIVAATTFTSGCARAVVTKRSHRRRAVLQASMQSLNFGGHISQLITCVNWFAVVKSNIVRGRPKELTHRRRQDGCCCAPARQSGSNELFPGTPGQLRWIGFSGYDGATARSFW